MNEVNARLAESAFLVDEPDRKYARLSVLVEAGIARVWHWMKGGKPYGMLSAEKHGLSPRENRHRSAQLSVDLAKQDLGGILVKGYYKEEGDPEPKPELAYFVPAGAGYSELDEPKFRNFLMGLAANFRQESILYCPGGGESPELLKVPKGEVIMAFNQLKFNPSANDLAYAWSRVRGHNFVFLESVIGADTVMGRWADHARGLLGGVHLQDLRKLALLRG